MDRKFDIRLWVLVTSNLNIYIYRQSYVRTSSSRYELSNTQDYLKHLTNNCFQVLSEQYGAHEEGNIIRLEDLAIFLRKTKCPHYSLDEHFFPLAATHAVDVVLSGIKKMKITEKSFELFGLDLLVDEDLRLWLLECNVNPHLGSPNSFMKKNVPQMVNEMLSLTVDPLFPPKSMPTDLELGNWMLVYNGATKKREHVLPTSLYPIPEFVPKHDDLGLNSNCSVQRLLAIQNNASGLIASTSTELKPRLMVGTRLDQAEVSNIKYKKGSDLEEELEQLAAQIEEKQGLEEEMKILVSLSLDDNFEKLPVRSKNMYSLDILQESLLKMFRESAININDLARNIERLFDIISAPRLYSEGQLCRTFRILESCLDTQFDYLVITQRSIQYILGLARYQISVRLVLSLNSLIIKMLASRQNLSQFLNNAYEIAEVISRGVFLAMTQTEFYALKEKLSLQYLQALYYLAGYDAKDIYVPGKSTELDLIRRILVFGGAPVVLACIQTEKGKIGALADRLLAACFSSEDLQLQLDLLAFAENGSVFAKLSTEQVTNMPTTRNYTMLAKLMVQKAFKFFRREMEQVFSKQADKSLVSKARFSEKELEQTLNKSIDEISKITSESPNTQLLDATPSLVFQKFLKNFDGSTVVDYLREAAGKLPDDRKKLPSKKAALKRIM